MKIRTLVKLTYGTFVLPLGNYDPVVNWEKGFLLSHCGRSLFIPMNNARIVHPLEELAEAAE